MNTGGSVLDINILIQKVNRVKIIVIILLTVTLYLMYFRTHMFIRKQKPISYNEKSLLWNTSDVNTWNDGNEHQSDVLLALTQNMDSESYLGSFKCTNGQITATICSKKEQFINFDQKFMNTITKYNLIVEKEASNDEYQKFTLHN